MEGGCPSDQRGFDARSEGDIVPTCTLQPFFGSKSVDLIVIRTIHPKINSDESYQGKDALLCLLTDKVDRAVIEEGDKLKVSKECKSVLAEEKSFFQLLVLERKLNV